MKKRLKFNGVIMFLAFMLVLLFPGTFFRPVSPNPIDAAIGVCGLAFILLGQLLRTSARGYKSEHSQQGSALIHGGPYTLSRNPMYLGILLIGTGIVLMLFKWLVVFIFLFIFYLRYILLIYKEEKKLSVAFPKEYQKYCQSTPRLLPRPKTLLRAEIAQCLPLRLSWLKKESGTILAVLLVIFLWKSWRDMRYLGANSYLVALASPVAILVLFIFLAVYLMRRNKENVTAKS